MSKRSRLSKKFLVPSALALERLADDDDPLTADLARWCLEHEFDLKDYFGES